MTSFSYLALSSHLLPLNCKLHPVGNSSMTTVSVEKKLTRDKTHYDQGMSVGMDLKLIIKGAGDIFCDTVNSLSPSS